MIAFRGVRGSKVLSRSWVPSWDADSGNSGKDAQRANGDCWFPSPYRRLGRRHEHA